MKEIVPTVFVVDPDKATHSAVSEIASALNVECKTYASGREFFAAYRGTEAGCLVLEVKIPDVSGFQIQRRLAADGMRLPLIFLTGHADLSLAVELMRAGAVHYLQKPLRQVELLNAIQEAMVIDLARRRTERRRQRVSEGIAVLSAREREVLRLIGAGKANRMIASELGLAVRTVELRRASLMKKLRLHSSLALLHFAILAARNGNAHSNNCGSSGARRRTTGASIFQRTG